MLRCGHPSCMEKWQSTSCWSWRGYLLLSCSFQREAPFRGGSSEYTCSPSFLLSLMRRLSNRCFPTNRFSTSTPPENFFVRSLCSWYGDHTWCCLSECMQRLSDSRPDDKAMVRRQREPRHGPWAGCWTNPPMLLTKAISAQRNVLAHTNRVDPAQNRFRPGMAAVRNDAAGE